MRYVVILGEDELERDEVTLRDMEGSGQEAVPRSLFLEGLNQG